MRYLFQNHIVSAASLVAVLASGCDRSDSETLRLSPAKDTPTAGATAGEQQMGAAQQRGAPPGEVAPTVAARQEQPTRGTNLARNFQGEMVFEITRPGQERAGTFRYASHSDKLRMQLQEMPKTFDILGEGDRLHVLNHADDTYRTLSLDELDAEVEHKTIRSSVSGKMSTIEGVTCEERTIHADPYRIEACIGSVPGEFEVGVLEEATGVQVPDWLATLLDEKSIPLRATAFGPDNKEVFSLKVTRYSPDPVPAALFQLPPDYRALQGK